MFLQLIDLMILVLLCFSQCADRENDRNDFGHRANPKTSKRHFAQLIKSVSCLVYGRIVKLSEMRSAHNV